MNEAMTTSYAGRKRQPISERFWSKVDQGEPDQCWLWHGAVNAKGYGRLTAGRGVHLKAHRVAYFLTKGQIPDEAHVLHRCDNPPCCNPAHIFLGTAKDNTHDMLSKNRGSAPPHSFGEEHHNTKFDEASARKIILDKRSHSTLAAEYGVSEMTIFRLKNDLTWKQLDRSTL